MADWTTIADTQVDPKAPVTSELMTALRDNPIAIAEGRANAPKVRTSFRNGSVTASGSWLTLSTIDAGEGFEADIFSRYTTTAGQAGNLQVAISDDNITWTNQTTLISTGVSSNLTLNAKFYFDRQTGGWIFAGSYNSTNDNTVYNTGTFTSPTNTAYIRFRVDAASNFSLRVIGRVDGGYAIT